MSINRSILFGSAASWFSRGVNIILGLVLLPVLFRTLPKEELGVWLLLGQSWATLGILDLGFGVTITRRIAFAKGSSESASSSPLTNATLAEIADLVATAFRIYSVLALFSCVIAFGLGFLYLQSITLHAVSLPVVWIAWAALCLSQALTVWGTPWICLLQGVGYVGWDAILTSFVSALTLIGQIVASLFGGGLVSLAIVAVAGALLQRIILFVFARRKHPELFNLKGNWRNDIFREILPLAGRAWLTAMGTILVQNTDGFFIAAAQGADNIPAFRAGFLVVLNVHMLAGVFASASSVFISHLWQSGDVVEAKRVVMRNLRIGIGLVLCGGAAVLAAGPLLFNLWLGPGNYAGGTIMWLFVVMFALEQQSFVLSTSCRATNDEAFAGWMMAGGILKLILAAILVRQLGLTGLVLGTIIAQAATTHWFVVVHSLDRLRISAIEFFLRVLAPCVAIFGITVLLCLGLVTILKNASDLVKVIAAFGVAAGALAIGSWLAVLDQAQRIRFLVTIGWLRSNDQMEGK